MSASFFDVWMVCTRSRNNYRHLPVKSVKNRGTNLKYHLPSRAQYKKNVTWGKLSTTPKLATINFWWTESKTIQLTRICLQGLVLEVTIFFLSKLDFDLKWTKTTTTAKQNNEEKSHSKCLIRNFLESSNLLPCCCCCWRW